MQESRSFHSQKIQRISPKKEDPQTPVKMMKKSAVQVSKNQQTTTASPVINKKTINSSPKNQKLQQKTISSEQIRIKSQQKLIYLKQCKQKKLSSQQIFQNYPFSQLQQFKFKQEQIRDQNDKFKAQIIQDQQGIHLVEEYGKNNSSKYIKRGQEEDENSFNGLSVSIFNNGNIFQGIYHNGHCCGLGFELHANGNTYIGNFKQGAKNGFGTYYWFANNEIYSGEWLNGLPHGQGIYIAKDRYEGNFANGLKHGFGQQIFQNGDVYAGEYVNSVADGYGEYYWKDGSIYKGDFKQGVRHGYGIWQDENEQYKGNYKLDKKQGFGIYKWKNKQIYKGQFRDDYRQGYGELYKISRQLNEKLIYSGCWIQGKKQPEMVVDENKIKQLYVFLDRAEQLDLDITINSKNKKKQRVGHKHCVPNQFSPSHRHH